MQKVFSFSISAKCNCFVSRGEDCEPVLKACARYRLVYLHLLWESLLSPVFLVRIVPSPRKTSISFFFCLVFCYIVLVPNVKIIGLQNSFTTLFRLCAEVWERVVEEVMWCVLRSCIQLNVDLTKSPDIGNLVKSRKHQIYCLVKKLVIFACTRFMSTGRTHSS